jgi:hypothetical protein
MASTSSSPRNADGDASKRKKTKGDADDGDLQYGEWIAAKRAYRASAEEREGLENRVRRLREEQRSMEATINNAKGRISAIDDARKFSSTRKQERQRRQEELERERLALRERAQASRQQRAQSIASARSARVESHASVRRSMRAQETQHERSSSARRAEEAAVLVRRREAIRNMQAEALEERRRYLANRKRELQQANARHGKRVTEEKADNVRVSSELLLVEADLLRNLVELKREARKQTSTLAERITGKRPERRHDDDADDVTVAEDEDDDDDAESHHHGDDDGEEHGDDDDA